MLTKQNILEEFNEEVPATRKMLERVPFDKLDFKPSPKSMPLGQMAFMVGTIPGWFMTMVAQDGINTSTYNQPPKPTNAQELVAEFDREVEVTRKALSEMDEATLDQDWTLEMGGKVVMKMKRGLVLSQTVRHLVHHRAQLGVYLKMNGIAHPSVYGPSGDEQ